MRLRQRFFNRKEWVKGLCGKCSHGLIVTMTVMVNTHSTGLGTMDSYIMLCTVHTTQGLGKEPEPTVSYCASPIPCTGPSPVPVQCV